MTKKVTCQPNYKSRAAKIRVRIIKAPLVNSEELKSILLARTRALVL